MRKSPQAQLATLDAEVDAMIAESKEYNQRVVAAFGSQFGHQEQPESAQEQPESAPVQQQ